jgi:YVTN family beta-propeller protein
LNRILLSVATLLVLQTAVLGRTESKITVGRNPDFVTVNSTTNTIYSSNSGDGTVSVIDGATGSVMASISLTGARNPKYAALGTGHQVLVSDPSAGKVFFINGSTKTLIGSLGLLYDPWGLAVSPVTREIYVALSLGTFVAAIAP